MQRRRFLQGVGGAILGLPLLESLLSQDALAATPQSFAIFMHQGNGTIPNRFWPGAAGKLTPADLKGKAVEPLTPFLNKLLFVGGIYNPYGNYFRNCDHAGGAVQCLTGAKPQPAPDGKESNILAGGISLDALIAKTFTQRDPIYLSAYQPIRVNDVMSYRDSRQPLPSEHNPFKAYQAIIKVPVEMVPDAKALLRVSANDLVREQMKSLLADPRLSKADKDKLELHASNVRAIENKIARSNLALPDDKRKAIEGSSGLNNGDYGDRVPSIARMHMDIIALATATGQTRAASIQVGGGQDYSNFNKDGVPMEQSYHNVSHEKDPGSRETLYKIDRLMQELFAYLLGQLSQYTFEDPSKNLLDYGCAVYLNSLENNDQVTHSHENLAHIVAGSIGGKLKQGYYVKDNRYAKNKFLSTIGLAMGIPAAENFNAETDEQKGIIANMMA
jgi:hypothetical protein